jgi:8-oxo-dGTP pyrophosphatase MutT (NUDIX family)
MEVNMISESIFNNGFFEFLRNEEEHIISGTVKKVKRNMVRRPPGIRAIIVDKENEQILLSKEFRYELEKWDYRLPGGKVFESLEDYKKSIEDDTVLENVEKTVSKEVKEEVGIDIKDQNLIKISNAGSGVIWDLFYFEITQFEILNNGQQLEEDEFIEGFEWKTYNEIIDMCINQEINEDRTVGVLLTYILKNKRI